MKGSSVRRWLLPTLLLVGLIAAWQVAASTGALASLLNLESFLVPSPAEIADALWQSRGLLAENAWVTLKEMVLGLGIALLVGIAFGLAMHLSGVVKDTFNPLIVAPKPSRSSQSPRSCLSGSASGSGPRSP